MIAEPTTLPKQAEGIPRQGTEGWHRARAGKVTSSRFGDLSRNKSNTDWGAGALTYAYEIVGERLLLDNPDWKPPPELSTAPIKWGNDHEDMAKGSYIWEAGRNVVGYGFVDHPEVAGVGGSPDGVIVGEPGILEIKCPYTTKEHVRTILTKQVPKQYIAQVQGNLWVTEREWCDFVSFDPRLAQKHTLCVVRVERDDEYIKKLSAKVTEFAALVDKLESEVRNGK